MQKTLDDFANKPLYISETSPSSQEILSNIRNYIERAQLACINGKECKEDLPIKNCSDNFIIFKESKINKVTQEDNCIYILAKSKEAIKVGDAFLYRILGII